MNDAAPTESMKAQAGRQHVATDEQARHARRQHPRASSSRGSSSGSGVPVSRFPSGTLLADRYRIIRMLGRGGMGEVYSAEDTKLGELVALKLLPEFWERDAARLDRLRNEVRLARSVTHPHVCRVHDIGEAEGRLFVSMEYIDGEDLDALLRRIGYLPVNKAIEIGVQICQGLTAIHESGILHRDLKPANLILDTRGRVRIADFGLASLVEEAPEHGVVQGTPAYMAPEQLGAQEVSIQSDLYALGLVLHKLLTGKPAFEARTPLDLLRLRTESAPPSPSSLVTGIPAATDAIVVRCLAPDPRARPASAREVATALAESTALIPAPALVVVVAGAGLDRAALVARRGEDVAARIVRAHGQMVDELCAKHAGARGRGGEAALVMFDRPGWAVAYALEYQRALAALAQREGVALASGVGMHLGVRPRQDAGAPRPEPDADTRGLAMALAALAEPDQILLTRSVFDLARQDSSPELGAIQWRAHGSYELAGMSEPVEVCEVGAEGTAPLVAPRESALAKRRLVQDVVAGWRPAPGLELPERPRWIMERKLGEGGFGEVWLAAHAKTGERRVFKFCYDAGRLRALQREITLFRLLKETLGDRDDIVRILDWSLDHAPYFIESAYTAGGNLMDWASGEGGLDAIALATRLEIVAQVATALAAAHSVGVLHKDVKPANVLMASDVAGTAHAQLGDFGIGAVTEKGRLAEAGITAMGLTVDARTGMLAAPEGTRLYMAPELLEGKPATIQADVYALGVLLYQVVFGDFARALAPGWERDIDDELLRADIAAAVDGDPARRLGNAGQLAERLRALAARRQELAARRREREEAARAREGLARARKRRRIAAVAGAVLAFFAAIVTVQSLRIAREAEDAAAAWRAAAVAGQTAQQVSDFLVSLFEEADPYATRGHEITARALLDRGKEKIDALAAQPAVQAELMHVMGVVYGNIGLYEESASLLRGAVTSRRALHGARHAEVADSLYALARTLENKQDYAPAEPIAREALALRRALLGDAHPDTADAMETLGDVLVALGSYGEAEPLYREMLAARRRRFGREHASVAQALLRIGTQKLTEGASREATRWFQDALDMYRGLAGDHQLDIAMTTYLLGSAYLRQDDPAPAERLLRESLAMYRGILSDDHPRVTTTMRELSVLYRRTGQHQQAEALGRDLLAAYRTSMGETSPGYAATLTDQAFLARLRGDCREADALSRQARSIFQAVFPDDHDLVAENLNSLGQLAESWGDAAAAEHHYRASLDMFLRLSGEREIPYTFVVMANLAALHVTAGELDRARPLIEQAASGLQRSSAAGTWRTEHVNSVRGFYLARAGDPAAGERLLLSSYRWLHQHHGAHRMYTQRALERVVLFHESRGEPDKAREYSSLLDQPVCSSPP
jgi:serine/threonine-protein kinase